MDRRQVLTRAVLGALGAVLLFFGTGPGIAKADSDVPSVPLSTSITSTTGLVVICIIAIVAVAIGVFFIRRARAKRRASGPGTGS